MSKGSSARAVLVGRMGNAIEVKALPNDNKVGNIRLATSSGYGERAVTSWHNIVVYDKKKIELLEAYTDKGSRIFIEGELRVREYDKDGSKRYITEIVVAFDGVMEIIDGRKDGDAPHITTTDKPSPSDLDDDVPF